MSYPLEVVAEKGRFQKMLGLEAIERTATAAFPKDKVTIRTNRMPTTTNCGCYTLYYNNPDGYRLVCAVTKMRDWQKGYAQIHLTPELYLSFNTGCVKMAEMDAFIETVKSIESKVANILRKEPNAQEA